MNADRRLPVMSLRRIRRLGAVVLATSILPATVAVALDGPGVESGNPEVVAQPGAPWHLDRIDGTDDGKYSYGPLGQGVYVYVIDSGIDHDHPDFTGRVLELPGSDLIDGDDTPRPCPPSEGGEDGEVAHGTHVASTAAGFGYGLAKEATIVPLRVFDCDGGGATMARITAALTKVGEHNASLGYPPAVVNMSLGGDCAGAYCEADPASPEYDTSAKTYRDAIEPLVAQGIVVVIAAGNDGNTVKPLACQQAPAFLGQGRDGVITIGNITRSGPRNSSSSYGACVDIYAPGTGVTAADDRDSTGAATIQGTSMAAPLVVGAVALALSENPRLTKEERPSAVWGLLSSSAAAFTSDKTPDAGIQLRLPGRWRNRSATTASAGSADVVFAEDVTGLETSDITFEGTATGCAASISSESASRYELSVTCSADGTAIPVLAAGAVTSVADSDTAPDTPQRLTYLTFDRGAPAVTAAPTVISVSGGRVTYELELDEPVFGLAADDFSVTGTATGCTVTRVSGTGSYYTTAVTCATNGTLTVALKASSVVDLAGNAGPATQASSASFSVTGTAAATPTTTIADSAPATTTSTSAPAATTTTTTTIPAVAVGGNTTPTTSTTTPAPRSGTPSATAPVPPTTLPVTTTSAPRTTPAVAVTLAAESTRGPLKGSTLSVGAGRITVRVHPAVSADRVLIEVRNPKGKTVRTLTVAPAQTRETTLFLPPGRYRVSIRTAKDGAAAWSPPALSVSR